MMSGTYPLAPTMINLLYRGIHQGANVLHFPANIVPDAYCLILQDMVFCLWNRLLYETSPWFIIRI